MPRGWPRQLIPQASRPGWPVQVRATTDTEVMVELAGEADLSLEKAVVRPIGCLDVHTELAVPVRTGVDRGLCTAWFTGSIRSGGPDAVGPDVTPRPPRPNR
jgi:hypothetical protein